MTESLSHTSRRVASVSIFSVSVTTGAAWASLSTNHQRNANDMPRRRTTAKPKAETTRKVSRTRKTKTQPVVPPPSEALEEIRKVYAEMIEKIRAGYGAFGSKEELAQLRERAQALQTAYPTLWEQVCREVDK